MIPQAERGFIGVSPEGGLKNYFACRPLPRTSSMPVVWRMLRQHHTRSRWSGQQHPVAVFGDINWQENRWFGTLVACST